MATIENIGRVVHVFRPLAVGDPFNSYELSTRQSASARVIVFTWNRHALKAVTEQVNPHFLVRRLPGVNLAIRPLFSEFPYIQNLETEISRYRLEIIHAHSHLFLPTLNAVKVAKKLGIPSVVTVHGVVAERDFFTNLLQYSYLRFISSRVFADATLVMCLTRQNAEMLVLHGCPKKKIRIIPNAVDAEFFKPGESEDNDTILWVGRMVPEKGVRFLGQIISLVLGSNKRLRFVIIGDGPLRGLLENIVRKNNWRERVIFLGTLDKKGVSKWLGRASAFLFTSVREGFPKTILEAMSSGRAIVAFDSPGLKEIVENGIDGIIVPYGDSHAAAKSILELNNDAELRTLLGKRARMKVLEVYSWKRVLDMVSQLYLEASMLKLG